MPYIGRAATNAGSVNYLDDISSGFDGNDVTFTCAVNSTTITPGQENVYIYLDGVFQHPGESYTISGSTITFTEAPVSGVDFTAYVAGEGAYLDDGTVSTAKLDDDAVTASKLDDDGTGFQVGDLGVGGSLTSGDKLTVTGRLRASGGIIGDLTGDVTGDLTGNVTGNVTGNASGTAATVTGAAQTAITSLGTLTSLTAGATTITGLTHLKGSAWNSILRLGDTSRSEQLTHINNGSVNFSIYTSNGTKGVLTANHDGSAMTLGADYGSGTLTVTPPTTFTGRVTLSNDGSDNGLFMGGGWQIFDNASEAFGTAGDLIFYHGAKRVIMADDGGFKIKQGGAGSIAKGFSLENAGDTNLTAAIFEENTNPTNGELRLYSGGSEKVYLRANSSSSNAFFFKGGQMQDITANNTGIQYRANWDTGFINRIDNNFDGASAYSSYMRFKIASGAGSQTTTLTLHGDGNVTAGSIMQSPNFRTGRNTTSVANTTWTQLSGLTNLSPGLYTIHAYIADYQATQWSAHGVVEHTGNNTMDGNFQNESGFQLRTNGKDIELYHTAGGTFTIQVSWIKQA